MWLWKQIYSYSYSKINEDEATTTSKYRQPSLSKNRKHIWLKFILNTTIEIILKILWRIGTCWSGRQIEIDAHLILNFWLTLWSNIQFLDVSNLSPVFAIWIPTTLTFLDQVVFLLIRWLYMLISIPFYIRSNFCFCNM